MSWDIGSRTLRDTVRVVLENERENRLARTTFAAHTNPRAAAQATLSLRAAYPWLSPNMAARLGAYGVPVDDPDISEIAGAHLGRRYRRGWVDGGAPRNTNEVQAVRAQRRLEAMNRPGWMGPRDPDRPVSARDLGIPTGRAQDYDNAMQQSIVPQSPWARSAHDMTPYERRQRWPELTEQFSQNQATFLSGRRIAEYEGADRSTQEQAAENWRSDPGYTPLPGEGDNMAGANPAEMGILPNANRMGARAWAESIPALDATVRHIRRGGLTFKSIPLPGGEVSAEELLPVWQDPEVERVLVAERDRLEAQYENLRDAEGAAPVEGVTPSMRAVYDGIVSALETLGHTRQSIGPDLHVDIGGFTGDWNASDLWRTPYGNLRSTVRTATMVMDGLWQGGQARFRQIVSDPGDLGNWASLNPVYALPSMTVAAASGGDVDPLNFSEQVGQTDIGIALEQLAYGRDVQTGAGFFVDPSSPNAQIRLERERQFGLIGGHVITMGRWTAGNVGRLPLVPDVEPDTVPFDILSGVVDLGWVLAEPGGALVDVAARSNLVRREIARAGGFTATRSFSDPGRFAEWLRGPQAQRVLSFFADVDPTDHAAVHEARRWMSNSGRERRIPDVFEDRLFRGEQGDTAYVENLLTAAVGMGYSTPGVPLARATDSMAGVRSLIAPGVAWRRRMNASRLAQLAPETGMRAADAYNADELIQTAESSMRNLHGMRDEDVAQIVGRLANDVYTIPARIRVQQLERELAELPEEGTVLRRVGMEMAEVDVADARAQILVDLDEVRPGVLVNRMTPNLNVLHDVWYDMQRIKRDTILRRRTGLDEPGMLDEWEELIHKAGGTFDNIPPARVLADRLEPEELARFNEIRATVAPHLEEVVQARRLTNLSRVGRGTPGDSTRSAGEIIDVDSTLAEAAIDARVGEVIDQRVFGDHRSEAAFWLRLTSDPTHRGAVNRRMGGMVDGEIIADGSAPSFAHMLAEHQGRYLPLEEDYRQLARLTRSIGTHLMGNFLLSSRTSGHLFAPWRGIDEVFMSKIWKPSRLLRPAYPIRVVGEEQFRIGAVGFNSAINHPVSFFGLVMGTRRDGRFHRFLDNTMSAESTTGYVLNKLGVNRTPDDFGRLTGTVIDDEFTPWDAIAEFKQTQSRGMSTWMMPIGAGSGGRADFTAFYRDANMGAGSPGMADAWTDLFARSHSSDDMRLVAQILTGNQNRYADLDEFIEAAGGAFDSAQALRLNGPQNLPARIRAELAEAHPQVLQRGERTFAQNYAAGINEPPKNWDDWVESLQVRLFEMTGRDPDLMHVVARGQFPDNLHLDMPNANRINPKASRRLRDEYLQKVNADGTRIAPEVIPGDRAFEEKAQGRLSATASTANSLYDTALERAFGLLASGPTDRLSRSVAFRQFHLRRWQDLMPRLTPEAQARFLDEAENLMHVPKNSFHIRLSAYIDEADSTSPTLASLRRAAKQGSGDMDYELADELARHAAMDNTRWLLYDVHKRGNFMDAARIVFPFGEAWKEVVTRWMQLTMNRPGTVIQRSTQLVQASGGQPQDWEEIVQDPSAHGQVFTNSTGETVFTYPGSEWFNAAMTGVPVELTGALNGLTMMNSVVPGFGPVVQAPLQMSGFLQNSPDMDGLREVLFPFGMGESPADNFGGFVSDMVLSPAVQRVFMGISAALAPDQALAGDTRRNTPGRWAQDFFAGLASIFAGGNAVENDRLFLTSVMDSYRYNVSSGRSANGTPAEIQAGVRDATRDGGLLYIVKGMAGMTLPSAPISEFQVEGNDGTFLMLRALRDRYRQLQQENFPTGDQRFLELYGENLGMVLQANSVPRTTLLPVTAEQDRWVQNHPGVRNEFPDIFGLMAPVSEDDNFDFDAFNRYQRERASEVLGRELMIEDLVFLANDRVASMLYRQREEELLALPRFRTEDGNLNEAGQRHLSVEFRPWLEENYTGFGDDGLHRGVSTDDLRRDVVGGPGEDSQLRRAVEYEGLATPIRNALRLYLERHDEIINQIRSQPNRYNNALTYYESSSARVFRDHLRYEFAPWLRRRMPEEYRAQWDGFFERVLDRVMLPAWDEEGADRELEVAA